MWSNISFLSLMLLFYKKISFLRISCLNNNIYVKQLTTLKLLNISHEIVASGFHV